MISNTVDTKVSTVRCVVKLFCSWFAPRLTTKSGSTLDPRRAKFRNRFQFFSYLCFVCFFRSVTISGTLLTTFVMLNSPKCNKQTMSGYFSLVCSNISLDASYSSIKIVSWTLRATSGFCVGFSEGVLCSS